MIKLTNIITLDFETYFNSEYRLKKMTTEAYVRDPRFKVHGCALKSGNVTRWFAGDRLPDLFAQLDWQAVLCHHAHFDGLILSHHYGIKPRAWLDTLSMARLVLGNHVRVGLDALAKHYGLAAKTVPYKLFEGRHWDELSPDVQQLVADGACHDVELTWQIFKTLAKDFPAEEYRTVDTTVRMFTEPVLEGDVDLLGRIWLAERSRKRDLLAELGVSPGDLQSADTFRSLMEAEGVEVEEKDGKSGKIPCFAKTDEFMKGLLDHENPRVAALAAARLGVRSTIAETRAERLGWMASRGPMCIYLSAYAAHTTRWGGGDKVNAQNLTPELQAAFKPPKGHRLAKVDASQIECRILNYVAGQEDVIENFRLGRDPYTRVASEFYGFEVNKQDHPAERQTGKILELQCGFGSGGPKIAATLRIKAGLVLTPEEGIKARDAYRSTHPCVVDYWRQGEHCLARMLAFDSYDWGPLRVRCDAATGRRRIMLPNDTYIIYDTLEWHQPENAPAYWRMRTRNGWVKLYGAKLVENVVQGMARVVVSQAMNRITAAGIKVATMRHDDIVACLPDDNDIYDRVKFIEAEMTRTPAWLPGIPLACDTVLGG